MITEIKNIADLQKEIEMLRSFVIGYLGRDAEGEYRPEFVREILKVANEKPQYIFKNSKTFLAQLRKKSK